MRNSNEATITTLEEVVWKVFTELCHFLFTEYECTWEKWMGLRYKAGDLSLMICKTYLSMADLSYL